MNNKIYVLLAVLLLLASLSSFVINVQGDTNVNVNNIQPLAAPLEGEDVLNVYPYNVPRYCDVYVYTYANTEVKVYRVNGEYTGIKCTTDSNGECTFNFGLKESKGLYYVQAQNLTSNIYLNTNSACDLTYSSDKLEILPSNVTLEAGTNYTFDVHSYLNGTEISSLKEYILSDNFSATILNSNNTNVQVLVTGAGEVELTAFSGKQNASSQITVLPNACSSLHELSMMSNFFAGSNISQSYLIMDNYGNLKSNEIVLCTITLPNGTIDSFNLTSDVTGVILLEYPVTLTGGYNVAISSYNPEYCGQSSIGNFPEVLPDYNSLGVNLMRGEEELNETVSMYVDDEFTFKFVASDSYSNILNENSYTCLINSSDSNIFEYLSSDTWNEYRIISGHLTGEANLTYTCYYGIETEPFETGLVGIKTTGNLNHPGAIYVLNTPENLMAGENITFEFALLDSYGYLIEDSVNYNYSSIYGEVIDGVYYAPTYLNGEILLVEQINVSYDNVNLSFNVNIIPNVASTIEINSSALSYEQNENFTLTSTVRDAYNNLVPNVEIQFSIISGPATLNEVSAITNNFGEAIVEGITGNVNGTVNYSGSYNTIFVYGEFEVLENNVPVRIPSLIECEVSHSIIFVNGNSTVTCTVYDQENVVLENALVEFISTGGILSEATGLTSEMGRVDVEFTSHVEGDYNITATVNEISSVVNVVVKTFENEGVFMGSVLNQALNPVSGTQIKVLLNGALVQTIEVNPSGNFIGELQPGIYDVIVEAPGYLTNYEYGVVIVSEQTFVRNYVLTTLSRLTGTVTNETSDVINDATIEIYRNNKLVETKTTGVDGKYEFTVASGIYTVKVIKEEYITSYFSLYLPVSTEVGKDVTIYR